MTTGDFVVTFSIVNSLLHAQADEPWMGAIALIRGIDLMPTIRTFL